MLVTFKKDIFENRQLSITLKLYFKKYYKFIEHLTLLEVYFFIQLQFYNLQHEPSLLYNAWVGM